MDGGGVGGGLDVQREERGVQRRRRQRAVISRNGVGQEMGMDGRTIKPHYLTLPHARGHVGTEWNRSDS